MKKLVVLIFISLEIFCANNQTLDLTQVVVNPHLPFSINVEVADFTLPVGIQSGAYAQCGSKVLFIAGRINGLHGFDNDDDNFPPNQQNTSVFVIDLWRKTVQTRSLYDASSGLTQDQIDTLSVTSPQFYQKGDMLYMTGGYGVDTNTGNFSTKPILTAINVPGLIRWVIAQWQGTRASQFIRQISNPVFQVTGGAMYQIGNNPTLLIMGQNFAGFYTDSSNGAYTMQVRRFCILDDGKNLEAGILDSTQPDQNYRRRDLNVVPIVKLCNDKKAAAFVALSGVFTLNSGVWTVPIEISACGHSCMPNPATVPTAFKQGMNNYNSAHAELFSKNGTMYIIIFGGLTYEYFQDGQFVTDAEIPFTNEITVIKRYKNGRYEQDLLATQFPTILSTASNPGNPLLFGTGARFVPAPDIPIYANGVLRLDKIKKQTVIGYIIGGIQSTLPNTNVPSDSAASPYIFKVILTPSCCR